MRRSTYNTRNPYLPMTEEDVVRRLLNQKTRRLMRKRKKVMGKWLARINSPSFLLIALCSVFAAAGLGHLLWRRHRRPHPGAIHSPHALPKRNAMEGEKEEEANDERKLTLTKQFPSLEEPFASRSKLVGLYFAASWCSMSTTVSQLLDQDEFTALLVPPAPPKEFGPTPPPGNERHDSVGGGNGGTAADSPLLSLVYVSSDRSHEEMVQYLRHRPKWMHVPYDSVDRTTLKRHFHTAAKIEMKELGMDTRKHEIPTLIVIDAASQQVLTFAGVKDVQEHGPKQAMTTWLELARLSQALDAKFASRDGDDPAAS